MLLSNARMQFMELELFDVQVVWALPEEQLVIDLQVARGTTIREAVDRSGISQYVLDFDLNSCDFGIFGARKDPGATVASGDRIEVYRPLVSDAKEIRRRRAR